MKLATYRRTDGSEAVGVVDTVEGTVADVQLAHISWKGERHPGLASMIDLMGLGSDGLDLVRDLATRADRLSLSDVELLSPVPVPAQIRDFNNFPSHIIGGAYGMGRLKARLFGAPEPERPAVKPDRSTIPEANRRHAIYYISNRFNVVGSEAWIKRPSYCEWFDYECEFGIFIGRTGRNIDEKDAAKHIFGFTIFNDFTARDRQAQEMEGWLGPTKGKSFDTGNALGPWIVTPDEVGDYTHMNMELRINGEVLARATSEGMVRSFESMIAYVSQDETLHVGEFFGSGTLGGGCALENDRWLADGDLIEVEFDRLGVLANRIEGPDTPTS